jgi:hypothetical protein
MREQIKFAARIGMPNSMNAGQNGLALPILRERKNNVQP